MGPHLPLSFLAAEAKKKTWSVTVFITSIRLNCIVKRIIPGTFNSEIFLSQRNYSHSKWEKFLTLRTMCCKWSPTFPPMCQNTTNIFSRLHLLKSQGWGTETQTLLKIHEIGRAMGTPGKSGWSRALMSRKVGTEHLMEAVGTQLHLETVNKPLCPCLSQ